MNSYLPHYHLKLLRWSDKHGRSELPWQQQPVNPYRVWVSEIMLQQTQVQTVIPYFQRFIAHLPTLEKLAQASEEQVLHLWSGLGYYRRARHLYQAARLIRDQHKGVFPNNVNALQALPGIGRSTAGAIAALCFNAHAPILDGNVRRVLSRLYALTSPPGTALDKQLWDISTHHTPAQHTARYNQAMMDLGATVCSPLSPNCRICPLSVDCRAYHAGTPQHYPTKTIRATLARRSTCMLLIEDTEGALLLEKRPAKGVWPHLWSFPEVADEGEISERLDALCLRVSTDYSIKTLKTLTHRFTHFVLTIQPLHIRLRAPATAVQLAEIDRQYWYDRDAPPSIGLPQPVRQLIHTLPTSA